MPFLLEYSLALSWNVTGLYKYSYINLLTLTKTMFQKVPDHLVLQLSHELLL